MQENNDLRLLTLALDRKITSATQQLKDKKLHYESVFPKWLSDVSSSPLAHLKSRICSKGDWKQCDFASASEILKEARHFLSD